MNEINLKLVLKLSEKTDLKNEITDLINYTNLISKLEKIYKDIDFNKNYGMAIHYERKRREFHDSAIIALESINNKSEEILGQKIYDGSFEDICRSEIAQAIMNFVKQLIDYNI